MSSHHIVGDSPFLKRVLVPFWIIRILVMVIEIAIYGLALVYVASHQDDVQDDDDKYNLNVSVGAFIAIVAVVMVVIIFCLLLDIVCIIKRSRRTLTPKTFLVINVIQTTIWLVFFALSAAGSTNGAGIGIAVFIFLSFLGLLIYASIIFHKYRKGTLRSQVAPGAGREAAYEPYNGQNAYQPYNNVPSPYPQPASTYSGAPEPKGTAYYAPEPHHESHEMSSHHNTSYGQGHGSHNV